MTLIKLCACSKGWTTSISPSSPSRLATLCLTKMSKKARCWNCFKNISWSDWVSTVMEAPICDHLMGKDNDKQWRGKKPLWLKQMLLQDHLLDFDASYVLQVSNGGKPKVIMPQGFFTGKKKFWGSYFKNKKVLTSLSNSYLLLFACHLLILPFSSMCSTAFTAQLSFISIEDCGRRLGTFSGWDGVAPRICA